MNDLIFALALLSMPAPVETPIDPFTVSCYQEILRNQAVADEILDKAESPNYLTLRMRNQSKYDEDKGEYVYEDRLNWEEQKNDLNNIQSRYNEIYSAPFTWERRRFPDIRCVLEMQDLNCKYNSYLNNVLQLGYRPDQHLLRKAIIENDQIGDVLQNLRITQQDWTSVWQKRRALAKLKDLLGDDDFYNGVLPPPVPLWRAETIK